MYYLPHLYDKQDCVQKINKEKIGEFDSVIGELPSHFTPEVSAFPRTVYLIMEEKRQRTLLKH